MMKSRFTTFAMTCLVASWFAAVAEAGPGASGPCLAAAVGSQAKTSTAVADLAADASRLDVRAVLVGPEWTEWIDPPRYPFDMLGATTWQAALSEVGIWVPLADSAAIASPAILAEFFAQCKGANAAGVVIDPAALPAENPGAARKKVQAAAEKAGIGIDFQALPGAEQSGGVVGRLARGIAASSTLCILPVSLDEVTGTPAADVVRALPEAWKHTRPVTLGDAAGTARFGNGTWVIAAVAGDTGAKGDLALDFLGKGPYVATIIQDGKDGIVSESKTLDGGNALPVALAPGTGLVAVLSKLAVSPAGGSFTALRRVSLQAADPAAEIMYTTDGSVPGPNSAKYSGPISLTKTSTLRAAIVKGDGKGNEVVARFNSAPATPPLILPDIDFFPGRPITVSIETDIEDADVRYTLDGSDATAASTKYTGPFELREKAIVSVRVMADGLTVPLTEWREYGDPPPPDPYQAHVFLSDLKPLKFVSGWNGNPRNDASIEDNPLSVAGVRYKKGIGTHAVSELAYAIKPEYKRFVSVCGTDDEHEGGTVVFAVYIDDKLQSKSEVVSKSTPPWKVSIPIPEGSKQLRLVVGDGGDGVGADHADWANAGFQLTE